MGLAVVKPKGVLTLGADFYHGNADDVFKKYLHFPTCEFIFLKASEGLTNHDPAFAARYAAVKAVGKVCGAYHFFHPSLDPVKQAASFHAACGAYIKPGDFLFIDWESTDNTKPSMDLEAGYKFIHEVERLFSIKCGIYGSPYFLLALGGNFQADALWIAEYGVHAPKVPSPCKDWAFWQYDDQHGADVNYFNGSVEDLKAFAQNQVIKKGTKDHGKK